MSNELPPITANSANTSPAFKGGFMLFRLSIVLSRGISSPAVGQQAAHDFKKLLPAFISVWSGSQGEPDFSEDREILLDTVSEIMQVLVEGRYLALTDIQDPTFPLPE